MTKQRLSKLQKTILLVLADPNNSCYCGEVDMINNDVKIKIFGKMARYVMGVPEKNSQSFSVCFSNSIRNLKKKDLVKIRYKSKHWDGNKCKKVRIDRIYLTDNGLKLITVINNKENGRVI